jgi:outer membrane protein OmpA-like peptidoglycan-associated protein
MLGASVLGFFSLCWFCLARHGGLLAAEASPAAGPLSTIALTWHGPELTIAGVVPDAAVRAQVQARVESLSKNAVIQNNLELGQRAAPAPWLSATLDAISAVRPALDSGEVRIDGVQVAIVGDVGGEAERTEILAAVDRALGAGFSVTNALNVTPEATVRRVAQELNARLAAQPVSFRTGTATLDDSARALLGEITTSLRSLPRVQVEVRAHVRGLRDERRNQSLSENRAKAVRALLVELGLDQSRVSGTGLGAADWGAGASGAEAESEQSRIELALTTGTGR